MTHFKNIKYTLSVLVVTGCMYTVQSQERDKLGTEVVNVVKPYTAAISDAFKVKESPVIEDEDNTQKEEIEYTIFSYPVASTFTPAKGKAASVDKAKKEKLFNNYATLAFGNYGTALAELYVTENFSKNEYIGAMLRHHSSQGGIKNLVADDKFYNTALDLTYGNQQKDFSWRANAGYQHQIFNWYGIDSDYFAINQELYNDLDTKQTYHTFHMGGNVDVEDSFFKSASLQYKRFWDGFDSAENRFLLKPVFEFDLMDTSIETEVVLDHVGTRFELTMPEGESIQPISFAYTNIGIQPGFVVNRDDWAIRIGAGIFYSMDTENSDSKLFVYPQITASYKVVGDLMIFYAGAVGALQQNSYHDFVSQNPFVSPNLIIAPTDRQYDLHAGLKGKLASNVSYNLKGSFINEKNRGLFQLNPLNSISTDVRGYEAWNSFGVVYDDVKTVMMYGEIKADLSKNVSFGVNGTFSSFSVNNQAEAWNLPEVTLGGQLELTLTEKWFTGLKLFYLGERKDLLSTSDGTSNEVLTIKGFLDANAHLGYKHNERLTGFLRLNNFANQNYQRWANYPVQQFQVLLGANYKFDF